jgi:hypothetical protein
MKIITNNQPRDVISGYELTEKECKEFDYIDWEAVRKGEDAPDFFRYKGNVYHLQDAEVSRIKGWDGMFSESFFSGVLIKYIEGDYGEVVIVGRYYA